MFLVDLFFVVGITVGCLILALTFFSQNPHRRINQIAAILSISTSIWILTAFLSDLPAMDNQALFLNRFLLASVNTLIVGIFYLSIYFPTPQIRLPRWINYSILFFTSLISILTVITPLTIQSLKFESWGTDPVYGWLFEVFGVTASIFLIVSLFFFVRAYRRAKGLYKTQMQYLFVGIFIFMGINLIVHMVISQLLGTVKYYKFGNYSAIFFVGSLGLAILKHKLLDIKIIIIRAVTYALTLTTLVFFYTLAFLVIGRNYFGLNLSINYLLILAFSSALLLFTFQPLKILYEKLTQNIFFKNPYSSSELLGALGEITRSTLTLTTLGKHTLQTLTDTMHLSRAALIISEPDTSTQIIHTGFIQKPEFTQNTLHNLVSSAKGKLLIFDDLEESTEKMLLRQEQISVVMPLKVKSVTHGLLILGEKASGEIYSQQDIDVLEILMPQLSVAIQNAKSYEEIKGFADTLKAEVAKATSDLKEANRHLKHLDKLKDEFVFIATHELKNPVTALKGYLSMLSEGLYGPIPPKMKDPFSQMQYSNQQLVDLVNDLLQIARAEAKTLTIATTAIDIKSLVAQICSNLKPLADQKHLALNYNQPKKDKLMVMADEARFKEIMNNLVSNAIKYSETGTITISHEFNEDKVITHVQDQGHGIAAKDQGHIFTRFFRVDEEAAKGIPGTGLGLFIVRQIVEKMHGKIWFNSVYGKGTIFSFSLPKAN